MSLFEHPEFDQHEKVSFFHDKASGLKAIIAVHNTNLGPSLGGCRMWPYTSSDEALTDVLRLSKGMTYKAALANLKQGGGKAVIIGDPRKDKSPALMEAMGKFVNSFGGDYVTAEDSGIAVQDLECMAKQSSHIAGTQANFGYDGLPSDGNPSPATAYGVYVGIKASVEHVFKSDLSGIKVAVQGLGHVGYRLAEHLHKAGAELYVADIYPDNLSRAQSELNAHVISPDKIDQQNIDVFAPCALGAGVNEDMLKNFNGKIIAGGANNQLREESVGQMLVERGILYAPDYVINAGGIIDIYHQHANSSVEALRLHLEGIGDTLKTIFTRADESSRATNLVANEMAEEKFK
jgi:leucine dehydrogenase